MRVSTIVPVFNGAEHIGEALESIFTQTHQPFEIIVVDDGSTDATAAVLAGFTDRVRVIRQANAGPAAARNRGVEAAGGVPELCVLHYNPSRTLFTKAWPNYYAAITDARIVYPWEIDRTGGLEGVIAPAPETN